MRESMRPLLLGTTSYFFYNFNRNKQSITLNLKNAEFTMDVPWTLRGERAACALDLAVARSGNMQIELPSRAG